MSNKINLYINVELESFIKDNLSCHDRYGYLTEHAHWPKIQKFLSFLYVIPYKKRSHLPFTNYWVEIPNAQLRSIFSKHNAKDITVSLEALGVIESTSYRVGYHCKSYKLKDEYRAPKAWKLETFYEGDSRFINKLIKEKLQKEVEEEPFKKVMKGHLLNLTIEGKKARRHILKDLIDNLYDESNFKNYKRVLCEEYTVSAFNKLARELAIILNDNFVSIPKSLATKHELEKGDTLVIKKYKSLLDAYTSNLYAIAAIEYITTRKETAWSTCKNGRLHTNLTNLSSSLRQYLKLDGKPITAPDIANSQPFFFALILIDKYRGKIMPEDVKEYIFQTSQGIFYNVLMDKVEMDQSKRTPYKKSFFGNVFFNKIPKKLYGQALDFKSTYPTVWGHICEEKENDYKALANRLQKTESSLMIDKVCKRLVERGIPILSLHDSIYSTTDNFQIISEEILNAFKQNYSITPTLRAA